jgi:hypothetical protein
MSIGVNLGLMGFWVANTFGCVSYNSFNLSKSPNSSLVARFYFMDNLFGKKDSNPQHANTKENHHEKYTH